LHSQIKYSIQSTILLLFPSILFGQFSAFTIADKQLPIQLVAQKSGSFCWAASLEMVLGNRNKNQCTLIKEHFKGFDCDCKDCPANNTAAERCPSYALTNGLLDLNQKVLKRYGLKGTIVANTPQNQQRLWRMMVRDNIENKDKRKKQLFFAQIQFDDSECDYQNASHIVVVNGYHASSATAQPKSTKEIDKYLYLQDPFPSCSGKSDIYPFFLSQTPTPRKEQEKICYFLLNIKPL
jgi:hypothetical protein